MLKSILGSEEINSNNGLYFQTFCSLALNVNIHNNRYSKLLKTNSSSLSKKHICHRSLKTKPLLHAYQCHYLYTIHIGI